MEIKKKLKILIVADNASAMFGGEAILPLHYFRILSERGFNPYLIVHERVKPELSKKYPQYSKYIIYIDDLYVQKLLHRISKIFPRKIAENTFVLIVKLLTSIRQKIIIKLMVENGLVNIVHQPTPVSPKQPSLIYNVGAPVIIGPMNGGMSYPDGFMFLESKIVKFLVSMGRRTSSLVNIIFPGKRKASLLLVSNKRTLDALPSSSSKNIKMMVENGVDLTLWTNGTYKTNLNITPTFVFMGRLELLKGVEYLLEAFANLIKHRNARLLIIGDGPEMNNLQFKVNQFDLMEYVDFKGFLPQNECAKLLSTATALVLPSLHECGGAVVLEAMAANKVVIAVDWGGPSDYLNSKCGILISPKSPEYLIDKLEESMVYLSENTEQAIIMGKAGRLRIEKLFDWEKKVDEMILNYIRMLS